MLCISPGREARHIVSRWREPPVYREYSDSGLKGRHKRQCAGASGLKFLILVDRWLTPPVPARRDRPSGPELRNFKTDASGWWIQPEFASRSVNRSISRRVSSLTWCSMPSVSIAAVRWLTPRANRNR